MVVSRCCPQVAWQFKPRSFSSSETGVNPGIRSWKKHSSERAQCQNAITDINITKKWRAETLQFGWEFYDIKPGLKAVSSNASPRWTVRIFSVGEKEPRPIEWHQCRPLTRQLFSVFNLWSDPYSFWTTPSLILKCSKDVKLLINTVLIVLHPVTFLQDRWRELHAFVISVSANIQAGVTSTEDCRCRCSADTIRVGRSRAVPAARRCVIFVLGFPVRSYVQWRTVTCIGTMLVHAFSNFGSPRRWYEHITCFLGAACKHDRAQ